jgi:predicted DsbA family dithiol-disulfide isomerase/riboflavin biosynthesis pyrimidine reductase
MPLNILVAHDFNCPWCWIGYLQTRRMLRDFDVQIEWLSYELYPDELPWEESPRPPEVQTDRPRIPSRFALAAAAEGVELPKIERPQRMRTHNAHEAVEFAKLQGVEDALIGELYRAYWLEGRDINSPKEILWLAEGIVSDLDALARSIAERSYADKIVKFDDDAYRSGVYNVPTFFIDGERYAEQPYTVLERAIAAAGAARLAPYRQLAFPSAPADRPYIFINMVSTVDGKTVTGERDEPVADLGSKTDHQAMRHIQAAADAVLVGGQSFRATRGMWYPKEMIRVVATRSGEIEYGRRFFTDAPERAFVLGPVDPPSPIRALPPDLREALRILRQDHAVERLLVEGGSELNAELLRLDVVDELFLTLAPKVKLGRDVPTYAGGEPLPRELVQRYRLIEQATVGSELFLRYRRDRKA